jgi:hypothetical protein
MRQDSMVIALERLEKALEALRTIGFSDGPIATYSAALTARMEVAYVVGQLRAYVE